MYPSILAKEVRTNFQQMPFPNTFILLWGATPPLGWGGVGAAGTEDLKSHFGSWCPATEVICFCSPNCFLESIVGVTHRGAVVGSCGASTCDLSSRLTAVASLSFSHSLEPESQEGDIRSPSPAAEPTL